MTLALMIPVSMARRRCSSDLSETEEVVCSGMAGVHGGGPSCHSKSYESNSVRAIGDSNTSKLIHTSSVGSEGAFPSGDSITMVNELSSAEMAQLSTIWKE